MEQHTKRHQTCCFTHLRENRCTPATMCIDAHKLTSPREHKYYEIRYGENGVSSGYQRLSVALTHPSVASTSIHLYALQFHHNPSLPPSYDMLAPCPGASHLDFYWSHMSNVTQSLFHNEHQHRSFWLGPYLAGNRRHPIEPHYLASSLMI